MNLSDFVTDAARRSPDFPAFLFGETSLTFGELDREIDALTGGLARLGLAPGDRCVVMMPNCMGFVLAYYALARMGAVTVPVNPVYRRGELEHIFSDSGARGFIGHSDFLAEPAPVIDSLPEMSVLAVDGESAPPGFAGLEELFYREAPGAAAVTEAGDPCSIIYTSGTTGLPKGAVLTHGSLAGDVKSVEGLRTHEPGDIVIGVLPLFHIYGQIHVVNLSMMSGLTVRLFDRFDPEQVIAAIEREESTVLYAVPTMINRLVEVASGRPLERSSLRFCVSGGASLPVEVLKRFEKAFGTWIMEGYGLTECSSTCLENRPGRTRAGSIGFPTPGFEVRIVDEEDRDVPEGEVGELVVRGPGVMKEYLNQQEATEKALRGGWLHTGDLARRDKDGYVFIVDRKKDLIIRGGYNVYPREVEEVLYSHPAVLEAAVLGIPHPDLGEEVAAAVVLKPGAEATADELRSFVKERIAPYKYPRSITFVKELPKSSTGKILKRDIELEG
jgi:long-chain acyl-CoA synthetase